MKKGLLLFVSMFLVCSAFAFNQGSFNLGGTGSLFIDKADSDADAVTTILVNPQVGYFVIDNVCADLIFTVAHQSDDDNTIASVGLGLGGRYFWKQAYVGADFQYQSDSYDSDFFGKSTVTSIYLTPKVGYLVSIASNVYLDLGVSYLLGVGDYGADGSGSNDSSSLRFGVGFQFIINP
jgi:hypothetical protein